MSAQANDTKMAQLFSTNKVHESGIIWTLAHGTEVRKGNTSLYEPRKMVFTTVLLMGLILFQLMFALQVFRRVFYTVYKTLSLCICVPF